jgi:PEGA domain
MRPLLAAIVLLVAARAVSADEDAARVAEARQRFVEGAALVKNAQWSEALAAFERSARLRPHPITLYNIGACERALGRYTRAREALSSAVGAGAGLPESLAAEARAFLAAIDRLLVHVALTVDPPEAEVALDGTPLAAGPTRGAWPLTLDPGAHIFTLKRGGFADVLVNRSFAPGSTTPLDLKLDRLPATLHLSCNRAQAIITVDGLDVGAAPVEIQRPGGSYAITMSKPGFVTYRGKLSVQPGEQARLNATLDEKKTPVYRKWWFWTAAAVVVAGASVGTYLGARAAQTPAVDGGGLGWAVKLR